MDIKIQIIVAAGVLLGLAAIINMIRKKKVWNCSMRLPGCLSEEGFLYWTVFRRS